MSMEEQIPTQPRPTRPPKQEVSGGVYVYTWDEEQVQIVVQRIREDSRHTPSAEIRIRGKTEGHIHNTRINLLSTQARNQVARHCAGRCTAGRDWDAIVEQFAVMTLDHWRQGEPVINLGTVTPSPEPIFRLSPFLLEGETTLIYGDGGIGKSYVAAYLASQIDQGIKIGGYAPIRGNVLYLDYETNSQIAARRFQALAKGFGFGDTSGVLYRFCYQPLASDIAEIQTIVAEANIEFIVVDSAGPACGGDPESASSAINYFTALRSLRKTSLTIAHRSKSGSVGPFGSVYWVNYPRATYELKKAQVVGEHVIHVALLHEKANEGRLNPSASYQFAFSENNTVSVTSEAMEDVPEFFDNLTIIAKAEVILREDGPRKLADLATEINYKGNPNSLASQLSRSPKFQYGTDGEGEKIWRIV